MQHLYLFIFLGLALVSVTDSKAAHTLADNLAASTSGSKSTTSHLPSKAAFPNNETPVKSPTTATTNPLGQTATISYTASKGWAGTFATISTVLYSFGQGLSEVYGGREYERNKP